MNYKRFRQNDLAAERQSQANLEFFQARNADFVAGNYLTEVNSEGVETQFISLSTAAKVIPHRLTRRYNGFFVIEQGGNATIFNTRGSEDDNFITLTASASVQARIWVF